MRKALLCWCVALILGFAVFSIASADEPAPKVIKVGISPVISSAGFYLAQERGYFKEQGLNVEIIEFGSSGAEILPVLASDQLQVGGGSVSPALFNAIKGGVAVKVVADKALIDPLSAHDAILVRKDLIAGGKVKGPADFKGLKVAVGSPGKTNILTLGLERFLKEGGLTLADVELVAVEYPQMVTALASGHVDAACAIEPFIAKAVDIGAAVRFRGYETLMPNFQVAVVYYGEKFMKERPDDAKKFVLAYIKGLRDYINAFRYDEGKDAVIADLIRVLKVKERPLYDKMSITGFNPDGFADKKTIKEAQDWYVANGLVKEKVDMESVVDDSFCTWAVQKLGHYDTPKKKAYFKDDKK